MEIMKNENNKTLKIVDKNLRMNKKYLGIQAYVQKCTRSAIHIKNLKWEEIYSDPIILLYF